MPVLSNSNARNQAPGGDTREASRAPEQTVGLVPFVRASDEHLAPGNLDVTRTLGASGQDLGIVDIPAYGHIRWLYIKVTATDADAGLATVAAAEDAPWSVLQNIALTEPNGATIVQFNSGFQLFLANLLGGYTNPVAADPRNSPYYSAVDTEGDFSFILRVPVEISGRDAVGALPNQDSAGQFKFRATVAPASAVYATEPDTLPSVRIQAWLSAWDQPEPQTAQMSNSVFPPASGTTAYWSVQAGVPVASGETNVPLLRKGNYLRTIIFVLRRSGSRANGEADWPTELRFLRDAFPARYYDADIWRHIIFERTGLGAPTTNTAGTIPNGVRVHDYAHEFDGAMGRENRDLWQPTRGSTRLEIAGSFGNAGTLDIITNDVAIADNVFL